MAKAKTVVLVRHGKAQERSEARPDEARELTKAGRRALRAQLPRALSLLKVPLDARLEVWTSSAARARQTADEVVRALGAAAPVEQACLSSQDVDAFLAEVLDSPADCVVAVGHNPFMEIALAALCGERLRYATGAVAAVRIDATTGAPAAPTPPARLLWFVQGPRSQQWGTLCTMEKTLAKGMRRVGKRLAGFLQNPDDVEALHAFRVSIRTLRSLLAFAEPFQKRKPNRAAQTALRAVVRETSYLRELDVLIEQVESLENPAPDLVAACARMRADERDRLLQFLNSKKAVRAIERARAGIERAEWKGSVQRNGLAPERVRERFASWLAALETGLANTDLRDAEAAHDLRKDAKRVRYVAEGLGALVGGEAVRQKGRMTEVQDRLGALCDARVNAAIVADFPASDLSDQARNNLATLKQRSEAAIHTLAEAQDAR